MEKSSKIKLSTTAIAYLRTYINKGKHSARAIKRAQILLLLNACKTGKEIAHQVGVSTATIYNVKSHYQAVKGDVSQAIEDRPRSGQPPKLTSSLEAHITALACSKAPDGRSQWTLRLLAEKIVELGYVEDISHECVRKCLKKVNSNPGRRSNGVLDR